MANKLIIVESPAKASTITKFIGGSTKVMASMGHIRDLPKSKLGIDTENNFEPEYINIRGKAELIKKLKKEAKVAKTVYLATDPDREGEAIAWHLAYILGISPESLCRVTFNEITKGAVQEAIKHPRSIDKNLFDAQQARRALDRIVGYKISPILWKKVKRGLSAGRVQSVAVKLIVDRENEIESFDPEEYWNIYANLLPKGSKKTFEARLVEKDGNKIELKNKEQTDKVLNDIKNADFVISDIKTGTKKRNPAPPFTTSTMQQEASRKLGFAIKKTMSVAQGLYEGVKVPEHGLVGLITYMRTDSTRISDVARAEAKKYIEEKYGKAYYENRFYKTKDGAQDAHEAIRPTYIDLTPEKVKESLTNDQFKLYNLIYNRFIASQMSTAEYDTIAVTINANNYNFKSNGQSIKFAGFMKLYVETKDNDTGEDDELLLPSLELNEKLKNEKIETKQSFTEPPPRYTEASIVKALEEKGIGRPSTYAPTISTILDRYYIQKEQKQLVPTELGRIVNKLLVENFSNVVNVEFTANIEEQFDEIAEGKVNWRNIIAEFYGPFEENVERVEKELEHVELVDEVSDIPCEKCGKMMVYKYGRYGKFLACPGFPECRNAKPIIETIDVPCPVCGGTVQIKKTKRGRKFFVCENNPGTCEYISWNKPKPGEKWEPKDDVAKETSEEVKKSTKKTTKKKEAKTTKKTTKKKSTTNKTTTPSLNSLNKKS
ncbi:MAG: type I DNA topoisomerase [Clostridia bacterium]|nr:type I DNA topoisomerase [Clostridia bacterium]